VCDSFDVQATTRFVGKGKSKAIVITHGCARLSVDPNLLRPVKLSKDGSDTKQSL
jgi:hypothetical protein